MPADRRKFLLRTGQALAGAAALSMLPAGMPFAAGKRFANRTMRIVVPLGPGGTADILARLISIPLGQALDATVVVENRVGAGGVIGSLSVARSAPDGLTLCLANASSHAISPAIQKEAKYDPVKDFAPVGLIAEVPIVLVASPTLGVSTLEALTALMKEKPGQFMYGSPGVGSLGHMRGEQLQQMTGTRMVHVPYKSTAEVSRALLADEISVAFDNLPVSLPQIRAKRIVLLATTGESRNPEFPSIPTFGELGYDAINSPSWFGLVAPAGTDAAVISDIHQALQQVLQAPELARRITEIGGELSLGSPAAFGTQIEQAFSSASQAAKAHAISL